MGTSHYPPLPSLRSLASLSPNGVAADAIQPSSQAPFPFFTLPAELRYKVLELLLESDAEYRMKPRLRTTDFSCLPVADLGVFAVSQKMKEEAEPIFYRRNVMKLVLKGALPMMEIPACVSVGSEIMNRIRRVHIHIQLQYKQEVPEVRSTLEVIVKALDMGRKLQALQITVYHHILYMYEYDVNGLLDQTIKAFSGLFEAGKVSCTNHEERKSLNQVTTRLWLRPISEKG